MPRTSLLGSLVLLLGLALSSPAMAAAGPSWPGRWIDDARQPFAADAMAPAPTVVTMSYGACRRVCSTSLRLLERLQATADARGVALNFVVFALDPQADRPEDWAAFRREHGLQRSNWHFLSGDADSVRKVAGRLGVRYWRYGEHLLHDLRILLLAPDGRTLRVVSDADADIETLLP